MNSLLRRSLAVFAVSLLALIWELGGHYGWLDRDLFPSIFTIFARVGSLLVDPTFTARDIGGSMGRLALASFIVLPLAVVTGILMGVSPSLRAALGPIFNFTFPLPKVALFPLILALFGIADRGKVVLIGIGAFYPLFFNVLIGTMRIRGSEVLDLVKLYDIHGKRLWFDVYLRGLVLDILTGLKASVGYGFTLVVVSEFTASNNGLGHFIWRAWDSYSIVDMYAGVVWLCILGWLAQAVLDLLIRYELAGRA